MDAVTRATRPGGQANRRRWLRRAQHLVLATLAYNGLEAAIAFWAGISTGSIALVGFGLDSIIELAAAAVVLWRLRVEDSHGAPERIETAENRVRRFVGGTFLALALYVAVESVWRFTTAQPAAESRAGLVLAAASLVIMPLLAAGKLRAAEQLGSGALRAEAKETLACAYLSLVLFLGLAGTAWAGWWWADAAGALLMVPWLLHEAWEGLSGERE
jgi:divalent metal cation (Fe/Co/Zn/Cd) transporter